MEIRQSRDESVQHERVVSMTAKSQWREAYGLLHTKCHLTHHEIRAIFQEHLGGLSYHRNMLHSEYKKDKDRWQSEANTMALLVNNPDVDAFLSAMNSVIYDGGQATVPYTLVKEVSKLVRSWNEWGESERQRINIQTKRVLARERTSGLKAWTERHLLTYLRINGIRIEV
jgi:hypothetical protein